MKKKEAEKYQRIVDKLKVAPVYLINEFEEAAVRSDPGGGYWIKFKEAPEFHADHTHRIVTEAIQDHKEITKEKYEAF